MWSADHTGTDKEAAEGRHSCAAVKAKDQPEKRIPKRKAGRISHRQKKEKSACKDVKVNTCQTKVHHLERPES